MGKGRRNNAKDERKKNEKWFMIFFLFNLFVSFKATVSYFQSCKCIRPIYVTSEVWMKKMLNKSYEKKNYYLNVIPNGKCVNIVLIRFNFQLNGFMGLFLSLFVDSFISNFFFNVDCIFGMFLRQKHDLIPCHRFLLKT